MADPETVTVPDLTGSTQSVAEGQLKAVGLLLGNVKIVNNATVPTASVIITHPPAGTPVAPATTIDLELSGGPAQVGEPNLSGLTQSEGKVTIKTAGLSSGQGARASSGTTSSNSPSDAIPNPKAPINRQMEVKIEESNEPVRTIVVPDVVGLTRRAAAVTLQSAGLAVDARMTRGHSDSVPADGVSRTNPDAGTIVKPGSPVALELSSGPEPTWTQYIPTALFAILGIIVLSVIVYIVTENGQIFLGKLADKEIARGLITFLIAIATVGIAVILAISTLILTEGDAGDKRFDRGKQVLSVLIGVLGTIVGFYFGSERAGTPPPSTATVQTVAPKITTIGLPDGTANKAYGPTTLQVTGLTPPLKWSVKPSLPAGLSLDSTSGTITGTPTAVLAKSRFTFTVTDSSTPPGTSTADLTLEIK